MAEFNVERHNKGVTLIWEGAQDNSVGTLWIERVVVEVGSTEVRVGLLCRYSHSTKGKGKGRDNGEAEMMCSFLGSFLWFFEGVFGMCVGLEYFGVV